MPSKKTTRTRKTKKQSQDCSITAGFQMVVGFLEKQYKSGHVATLDDAENKIVDKFLDTMEKHIDWANSKQIELVDKKMVDIIKKFNPEFEPEPHKSTPLFKIKREGLKQFICRLYPKGGFQLGGSPNKVAEYFVISKKTTDLRVLCAFLTGIFLIICVAITSHNIYLKYYTALMNVIGNDESKMNDAKEALSSLINLGNSKTLPSIAFNLYSTIFYCGSAFGKQFLTFFAENAIEPTLICATQMEERSRIINTEGLTMPSKDDTVVVFLYKIFTYGAAHTINLMSLAVSSSVDSTYLDNCLLNQREIYQHTYIQPDLDKLKSNKKVMSFAINFIIYPSILYLTARIYPYIQIKTEFDFFGNQLEDTDDLRIEHSKSKGRRRKMRRTRKLK